MENLRLVIDQLGNSGVYLRMTFPEFRDLRHLDVDNRRYHRVDQRINVGRSGVIVGLRFQFSHYGGFTWHGVRPYRRLLRRDLR